MERQGALDGEESRANNGTMKRSLILYAAIAAGLWPQVAPAWPSDPTVNLPICISRWDQYSLSMASDGTGGAILAWEDTRFDNSGPDIYAARVCGDGTLPWRQSGVGMRIGPLESTHPRAVADGEGGAILVWYEGEPSASIAPQDLYAQRIDQKGDSLWRVRVASGVRLEWTPTVTSDDLGGVILVWRQRNLNSQIHAQRVRADGMLLWGGPTRSLPVFERSDSLHIEAALPSMSAAPIASDRVRRGTLVCDTPGNKEDLLAAADGNGGAFVAWTSTQDREVYLQHVAPTGVVSWAENGITINTSGNAEAMIPDGSGGVFIAFNSGMHVARFAASGQQHWVKSLGAAGTAEMVQDESGGVIIAYDNTRRGTGFSGGRIYAQRLNAEGQELWPREPLCQRGAPQDEGGLVADGAGGAYFAWWDSRATGDIFYERDIYAQHVNADGTKSWPADGIAVCTAPEDQSDAQLVLSSTGGALIAWVDCRRGTADIYAQHVDRDGNLGESIARQSTISALRVTWKESAHSEFEVSYELAQSTQVVLHLYDVRGRRLFERDLGLQQPGLRSDALDLRGLACGQYLLSIRTGTDQFSQKITVTH